jgi:hypothetical protein
MNLGSAGFQPAPMKRPQKSFELDDFGVANSFEFVHSYESYLYVSTKQNENRPPRTDYVRDYFAFFAAT